jgi:hypothetical protein
VHSVVIFYFDSLFIFRKESLLKRVYLAYLLKERGSSRADPANNLNYSLLRIALAFVISIISLTEKLFKALNFCRAAALALPHSQSKTYLISTEIVVPAAPGASLACFCPVHSLWFDD